MITKSVHQMLKDGELRRGMVLKLRGSGEYVTFDSIVEINYNNDIIIKVEGGKSLFLDARAFEDVVVGDKNVFKIGDGEALASLYKKVKDKKSHYHFFDNDINFNKLCIDALEDKKVWFIVIGCDKAYVGLLQSGQSVGIPAAYEDFTLPQPMCLNYISDLPYGIFEIPKTKINSWKKKLEKYSEDYYKWVDSLETMIKDRNREKERNKFTVLQF